MTRTTLLNCRGCSNPAENEFCVPCNAELCSDDVMRRFDLDEEEPADIVCRHWYPVERCPDCNDVSGAQCAADVEITNMWEGGK